MERPFRWAPPEPPATGALVRERLLAPLARRFEVRLVVIEAGAGFGKTTLLAQAIAENRLRPAGDDAWLGCEAADSSPSTLLSALLRTLHVEPAVGLEPTVEAVSEAVWARAPAHVCLILDDGHVIDSSSPGWSAIASLVDELPGNGHLMVAGRSLGALPLHQLLAKHDAITIGEEDLRFDDDELRAIAAMHGVDAADLEGIAGWPALAELRATTRGTPDDALLEELLTTLEPNVRHQLAVVVAVGGGDTALLTAALGEPPDLLVLGALPLVRPIAGGGLQAHALWEHVLERELTVDEARDARRRAAAACTERDDNRTAFELLAAAGDWDAALPVLFEACHDQLDPPWPDTLARWRAMVPRDLADRPEAVYVDALIARIEDPWSEEARASFEHAERQFRARGDAASELRSRLRATAGPWLRADHAYYEANLAFLEELGGGTTALEPLSRYVRAGVAEIDLDHETALAELNFEFNFEPRMNFFGPMLRSFAHLIAGNGPAARADAALAREMANVSMGAWGTQLCVIADAVANWVSGDLDAVNRQALADPGPRWSIAERVPTVAVATIFAAHQGRIDDARALLREAHDLFPDVGDRDFLAGFLAVAEATILVASGDESGAKRVVDALLDRPAFSPATSGRALIWFGALPALVSERAATFVDRLSTGLSRGPALQAVGALRAARAGEPPGDVALLDDARALLTVLPLALAVELACAAAAHKDARGRSVIETLCALAPRATRDALQHVAASGPGQIRKAASTLLGEIPIPPPEPVRVEVFGPVRLRRGGEIVGDRNWRRDRVRHLLLLLVDRRAIRRAEAADLLWPDLDADALSANLRTTLNYVHGILEPHRRQGEATYLLQQDAGVLRLAEDEFFTVDAWELEQLLDRAAAAERDGLVSGALSHLLDALSRWRGPYLDDVAVEEWAAPARRRMHERVAAAGIRASELLVAGGRAPEAVGPARTALEADPYSEAAYRALIAAHLACGDGGAATRALAECEAVLADLGVEPAEATRALIARIERAVSGGFADR